MNKLVIFIDITERSDEIINKFRSERYTAPSKVSWIEDVENHCIDNYEKKVLIWHLSSSRIDNGLFSLCKIKKACELLDKCQFTHKFGVTDNDESYKQQVRATKWFTAVESWAELRDRFSVNVDRGLEGREVFIKATKKYLLYLLLPLDIDMQALQTTENKESYLNNMYSDLDELCKSGKYKDGKIDEHYRRKLYSLWLLLGASLEGNQMPLPGAKKLAPINNSSNNLLKLAGLENGNRKKSPIYKFLESLDTAKKDSTDVTAEDLCKPFNLEIEVNGKKEEINSFHNWYCALASCLRGAEKAVKGSN